MAKTIGFKEVMVALEAVERDLMLMAEGLSEVHEAAGAVKGSLAGIAVAAKGLKDRLAEHIAQAKNPESKPEDVAPAVMEEKKQG